MARPLINVPKQIARGESFDVKVLISHPMESGQRRDDNGAIVPRRIIKRFTCVLDGEEVMSMDLFPAIAANPFLVFSAVAEKSGTLTLTWVDDDDRAQFELVPILVS